MPCAAPSRVSDADDNGERSLGAASSSMASCPDPATPNAVMTTTAAAAVNETIKLQCAFAATMRQSYRHEANERSADRQTALACGSRGAGGKRKTRGMRRGDVKFSLYLPPSLPV